MNRTNPRFKARRGKVPNERETPRGREEEDQFLKEGNRCSPSGSTSKRKLSAPHKPPQEEGSQEEGPRATKRSPRVAIRPKTFPNRNAKGCARRRKEENSRVPRRKHSWENPSLVITETEKKKAEKELKRELFGEKKAHQPPNPSRAPMPIKTRKHEKNIGDSHGDKTGDKKQTSISRRASHLR